MSCDDGRECVAVATTCPLEERLVVHLSRVRAVLAPGSRSWMSCRGSPRRRLGLRAVSRIREAIDIAAPPERVWAAVHGDIPNVPRWSRDVVRVLYYALPKVFDLGNIARRLVIGAPIEDWMPVWSSALFGVAVLGAGLLVFSRRNY